MGGSGVMVVGALDGGTRNNTGATISGSNIYLQSAGTDYAGLVNTTTQSFAGAKTFTSTLTASTGTSIGLIIQSASQALRIQSGNRVALVASDNSNMWNLDNSNGSLRIFREDYNATGPGGGGSVAMSIDNGGNALFYNAVTFAGPVAGAWSGSFPSQGLYLQWNQSGLGTTEFVNQAGNGSGGFNFWSGGSSPAKTASINAAGAYSQLSDRRLKTNIVTIDNALSKIQQLNGVNFDFINGDGGRQTGLIAQDVQAVLPEAVSVDPNSGILMLSYGNLAGLFVQGIKEQQAQIQQINSQIASLQDASLKNGGNINGNISISGNLNVTGSVTIAGDLHTGDIYIGGHLASKGATPTVIVGSALGLGTGGGIGAPAVSVDGTDTAGTISITAGTKGLLSGVLAHVDFDKDYAGNYKVVISASNDHAAGLRLYTANKTTTGFDVLSSDVAVPGQQYQIDYIIVATSSP